MMLGKIRGFLVFLVVLGLAPGIAQADHRHLPPGGAFERVVGFGDSLSDPGNAFALTGDFTVRPFQPVPAAPYLIGLFRFTNGPVWLEVLARLAGVPRSGRPAFFLPGINTNYAIGAARARSTPDVPVSLATEIDAFLADFDQSAAADWLYAVWIGANDLRDAGAAIAEKPGSGEGAMIIQEALEGTSDAIVRLYAAGARTFLVFNMPDIGDTPAAREAGTSEAARALALAYNAGLEETLTALEDNLPGIELIRFDIFALLDEAVENPRRFGFKNATQSCITPFVVVDAICPRPRRYLFWDFIHPTAAAHRIIGRRVAAELARLDPGPAWAPSPPVRRGQHAKALHWTW